MKVMASARGQGANRSNTQRYCEDSQRRHRVEDALSCFEVWSQDAGGTLVQPQEMRLSLIAQAANRSTPKDLRTPASWAINLKFHRHLGEFPCRFKHLA